MTTKSNDDIEIDLSGVSGDIEPVSPETETLLSSSSLTASLTSTVMQLPGGMEKAAPMAYEWLQHRRSNIQPWSTFLSTGKFKAPASIPRVTSRVIKNIEHFQSNYLFVFIILIVFCLLTSPLLLLAVAGSLGGCYVLALKNQERKVIIGGHEIKLAHQYAAVAVFSIPIFYMAGAGAAIFWVIGASFFVIMLHAAFFNIDAVLGSDEEPFGTVQMEEV